MFKVIEFLEKTIKAAEEGNDELILQLNQEWKSEMGIEGDIDFSIKTLSEIVNLKERGYTEDALKALKLYEQSLRALTNHFRKVHEYMERDVAEVKLVLLQAIQNWMDDRPPEAFNYGYSQYEQEVVFKALKTTFIELKNKSAPINIYLVGPNQE
jgi:hypothetical protein